MTALRASIATATCDLVKGSPNDTTAGTGRFVSKTPFHDGVKAGVVVLVLSFELPEGEFVGHDRFSYDRIVPLFLLVVKGYIPISRLPDLRASLRFFRPSVKFRAQFPH